MAISKREACFIGGEWVTSDQWMDVDDPATGQVIGRVPRLGRRETQQAIAIAARAMGAWANLTGKERARTLRRYYELIIDNQESLAALLTQEQGKPLTEALAEIIYAASFIEWFSEEAKRVYGDVIPGHAPDKRIIVLKQPIGVVAAITPWNFPAAMITRKIGPALAAGCSVIVKPAAQTPFTALALAELGAQAGLPNGVLNVLTGGAAEIGGALTASETVRKLSFTGSTEVGAKLYAQCAPTIKKLSLELGGNAPFIVCDDADLDAAVTGAIQSKFRNAGQTCVCANRIYAHEKIHDAFIEKLAVAVSALHVAPGCEPGSHIGPLIDERAVQKVREHIEDAVQKGARIVTGGAPHARGGRFFTPTVIAEVNQDMIVSREETFGPLAPVFRFRDDAEAITQANATPFGLAAYFYARDLGRVWRIAEQLEAGIIGVNTGLISTELAPFGGVKASGLGREGSKYGMDDFLEIKYVCMGI
ncbi:succinate-semialdehyde dehydrogenase [Steroidobacter denitrificans]|uniref:Succinate-semialdehyde dehydrogenase n=1 Tax=Steroidobacter denitrificans TaxID=465721 RepID=A0A127FBF5_STEDE|nr:NAD-dependent succinate-semialdehyde dehydrogenase [Steroidobacter denitrificans]AMN47754.1 succinate-semialdehyde dehydrogenase [Steroidobacter denitrificans]